LTPAYWTFVARGTAADGAANTKVEPAMAVKIAVFMVMRNGTEQ
jgi:precorrin-6x reductase